MPRSKASRCNLGEAEVLAEQDPRQPAVLGDLRSEQSRVGGKGTSGRGSRIGEQRAQESQRAMEDKEDGSACFFLHQVIDFAPAPTHLVL